MTTTGRLDRRGRRRRTSALLAALRELSVPMSSAISRSVGDAYDSNGAVLVLTHLAEHGASRPGELGRVGRLSRGGMSNMLKRFERNGVVERTPGPGDGRSVLVSLTPGGVRLEQRLCEAVTSSLSELRPVVKEAIVLLVELGATSPTPPPDPSGVRRRRIVVALAEAGVVLGEVVSAPGPPTAVLTPAALDAEGPCRVGRVAQMLAITSGGATRVVEQLDGEGLVRRVHGVAGDGRGVAISLTARGERRLESVADDLSPHLDLLLGAMRSAAIDLDDDR